MPAVWCASRVQPPPHAAVSEARALFQAPLLAPGRRLSSALAGRVAAVLVVAVAPLFCRVAAAVRAVVG